MKEVEYEQLQLEIPVIMPPTPVQREAKDNDGGSIVVDLSENVGIEIIDFNIL